MGLRTWLTELQIFMTQLKRRSFSGVPLNMRERQVLQWYAARWRELRGGAVSGSFTSYSLVARSVSRRGQEESVHGARLMSVRYGEAGMSDRLDVVRGDGDVLAPSPVFRPTLYEF